MPIHRRRLNGEHSALGRQDRHVYTRRETDVVLNVTYRNFITAHTHIPRRATAHAVIKRIVFKRKFVECDVNRRPAAALENAPRAITGICADVFPAQLLKLGTGVKMIRAALPIGWGKGIPRRFRAALYCLFGVLQPHFGNRANTIRVVPVHKTFVLPLPRQVGFIADLCQSDSFFNITIHLVPKTWFESFRKHARVLITDNGRDAGVAQCQHPAESCSIAVVGATVVTLFVPLHPHLFKLVDPKIPHAARRHTRARRTMHAPNATIHFSFNDFRFACFNGGFRQRIR